MFRHRVEFLTLIYLDVDENGTLGAEDLVENVSKILLVRSYLREERSAAKRP